MGSGVSLRQTEIRGLESIEGDDADSGSASSRSPPARPTMNTFMGVLPLPELRSKTGLVKQTSTVVNDVMLGASHAVWQCDTPLLLDRSWLLSKLVGFGLAGFAATFCVAFPLGEAFRENGDNGILANWAYYFVYNVFGWGGLWIKLLLTQCWIWNQPYFIPFMKNEDGLFKANKCFAAFVICEVFAVLLFLFGYFILEDPVPLGTISFGVPCVVVCFVSIYFLVIPKESRRTVSHHLTIMRVWLPTVLWFVALIGYTFLLSATHLVITKLPDRRARVFGLMCMHTVFLVIRSAFCMGTEEWFIGSISPEMGMLWRFTYKCQMTNFTMWLFPVVDPGMWITPLLSSICGAMVMAWHLYRTPPAATWSVGELLKLSFCLFADICSAANFIVIFAFNHFGPNKRHIYIFEDLTDEQVYAGILKILFAIFGKILEAGAFLYIAKQRYSPGQLQQVRNFFVLTMNQWYWIIWTILVSSTLTCGACMVMKHDGMDLTLSFEEWSDL
eukprot:TRINITY_DN62318_c0_g1_i1.p1 TRINITY_DN62318_c0_g1~~TRINITY_DN62318_c0_g1_i1.p1  ORF type:complete len:501 (-),score=46.35 TRINITY_DN62318_c0_g1_i1:374-1876(-)